MTRLLVVGGTGLLGRALLRETATRGIPDVVATHHSTPPGRDVRSVRVDLTDDESIAAAVAEASPDLVINAAYAKNDTMDAVTGAGPARLAAHLSPATHLVQLSTDIVFDGDQRRPYVETDPVSPVNDYGRAKAHAEAAVATARPDATIVRTSLLYGGDPPTVQEALVRQGVRFFTDEVRCPLRVDVLARAVLDLGEKRAEGRWHVAGAEALDRLSFARLLAPHCGVDPATLDGGPVPADSAPRPRRVELDSSAAERELGYAFPGARRLLGTS